MRSLVVKLNEILKKEVIKFCGVLTPNPQRGLRHILYKKIGRFIDTASEAPFEGLGVEN